MANVYPIPPNKCKKKMQKRFAISPSKKVSDPPREVTRPAFTGQNARLLQARRPTGHFLNGLPAVLRAE
jgi:hypothetical protein